MPTWKRLLLALIAALLLPVQAFAVAGMHCGGVPHPASVHAVAGQAPAAGQPCAMHESRSGGLPGQVTDPHAFHGAACAACCAAPASTTALALPVRPGAVSFAPVAERFAQFVPPGLKRPPSIV
jgi:hypothetical protein